MSFSEEIFRNGTRFIERVRFRNGKELNYKSFYHLVKKGCAENGIPIAFKKDTIEKGSIFNRTSEPALVMYHPDHESDYVKLLVRITYQGSYAFLDVMEVGGSRNIYNDNRAKDLDHPFRAIGRGLLNSFSDHNSKLEEEINYYTILEDCLRELFL